MSIRAGLRRLGTWLDPMGPGSDSDVASTATVLRALQHEYLLRRWYAHNLEAIAGDDLATVDELRDRARLALAGPSPNPVPPIPVTEVPQ